MKMLLAVFVVLLVSSVVRNEDEAFDVYDYHGDISQSILRLYYGKTDIWARQPQACYGVLVDWKIALFPCSCMSYTKDDKQTNTAWRHTDPVSMEMVDVNSLEVGTMFEEYESRYGNDKVKIAKYVERPTGTEAVTCNSDLLYEWTAVELQRRINFSTLIWFPTANLTLMRNLTEDTILQSRSGSLCRVVYWDKDVQTDPTTGNTTDKYLRLTQPVYLTPWPNCNDTVCPTFEELKSYKVDVTNDTWNEDIPEKAGDLKQDPKICRNEMTPKKRSCVGWRNGPVPICGLVPGTPVLCDSNRFSGGIVGTITNTTLFCPTQGSNVLITPINLVSEAMPLVQRYLRIQHAPGYDGFFTLSPNGPGQLFVLPRSPASGILPSSVLTPFICIVSVRLISELQ